MYFVKLTGAPIQLQRDVTAYKRHAATGAFTFFTPTDAELQGINQVVQSPQGQNRPSGPQFLAITADFQLHSIVLGLHESNGLITATRQTQVYDINSMLQMNQLIYTHLFAMLAMGSVHMLTASGTAFTLCALSFCMMAACQITNRFNAKPIPLGEIDLNRLFENVQSHHSVLTQIACIAGGNALTVMADDPIKVIAGMVATLFPAGKAIADTINNRSQLRSLATVEAQAATRELPNQFAQARP
jgi:hypothetical protein